jgi:hypothetical protein
VISGPLAQAFNPAIDDDPIREGDTGIACREELAPAACTLAKAIGQA